MHVSLFHIQGSSVEGFLTDFFTDKLPQPQRWEDALKFFKISRYDTSGSAESGGRTAELKHGALIVCRGQANVVLLVVNSGNRNSIAKNSGTCR